MNSSKVQKKFQNRFRGNSEGNGRNFNFIDDVDASLIGIRYICNHEIKKTNRLQRGCNSGTAYQPFKNIDKKKAEIMEKTTMSDLNDIEEKVFRELFKISEEISEKVQKETAAISVSLMTSI